MAPFPTVTFVLECLVRHCIATAVVSLFVLWSVEKLLGKDHEKNETTAVAMQWHVKNTPITIKLLLETVFSM
jgi:hypothetical protein